MSTVLSVANLLEEFKKKGLADIDKFLCVKHGPMIGDMYEGLTKEIVGKSIFKGLDLHVVSGKITNCNGMMSKQIDCMVVVGKGKKLPYSEDYLYDIEQVIMVVEVKKELFSSELSDSYDNLQSVMGVQSNSFKNIKGDLNEDVNEESTKKILRLNVIDIAFRDLANKPLAKDIYTMPMDDQLLYHTIVTEAWAPLRVIFGYYGFKDENSLRKKFIEYLQKNMTQKGKGKKGYGGSSFPNLIIAENASLIKTNAFPYAIGIEGTDKFCWMASYRRNPLILLLELFWTKLEFLYGISPYSFDEGLQLETLAPLIAAKVTGKGWIYDVIPMNRINPTYLENDDEWMPVKISRTEWILLNAFGNKEFIEIDYFKQNLVGEDDDPEEILKHLINERIIYVDGGQIRYLTFACETVAMPDGNFYAADNSDGRLTAWIENFMNQHKG